MGLSMHQSWLQLTSIPSLSQGPAGSTMLVPGTWNYSLASLGGSWFNVSGPGVSDAASLVAPPVPATGWQSAPLPGQGENAVSRDFGIAEGLGAPGLDVLTPFPLCLAQVNVTVDYIRPASSATETVPAFSERTCATVSIGGM